MSEGLPAVIDPLRLADQGASLRGSLPLAGMSRLQDIRPQPGRVEIDLEFGRREDGVPRLRGRLAARLSLTCQRCLQPLDWELRIEIDALLLTPEEDRARADEAAEALVVSGPRNLAELVEDELILGLPMMPVHPRAACPAADRVGPADAQPDGAGENPFAVLEKLKRRDE